MRSPRAKSWENAPGADVNGEDGVPQPAELISRDISQHSPIIVIIIAVIIISIIIIIISIN